LQDLVSRSRMHETERFLSTLREVPIYIYVYISVTMKLVIALQ
jgi:hypothetical protein